MGSQNGHADCVTALLDGSCEDLGIVVAIRRGDVIVINDADRDGDQSADVLRDIEQSKVNMNDADREELTSCLFKSLGYSAGSGEIQSISKPLGCENSADILRNLVQSKVSINDAGRVELAPCPSKGADFASRRRNYRYLAAAR